jgi:hypothetical protein
MDDGWLYFGPQPYRSIVFAENKIVESFMPRLLSMTDLYGNMSCFTNCIPQNCNFFQCVKQWSLLNITLRCKIGKTVHVVSLSKRFCSKCSSSISSRFNFGRKLFGRILRLLMIWKRNSTTYASTALQYTATLDPFLILSFQLIGVQSVGGIRLSTVLNGVNKTQPSTSLLYCI